MSFRSLDLITIMEVDFYLFILCFWLNIVPKVYDINLKQALKPCFLLPLKLPVLKLAQCENKEQFTGQHEKKKIFSLKYMCILWVSPTREKKIQKVLKTGTEINWIYCYWYSAFISQEGKQCKDLRGSQRLCKSRTSTQYSLSKPRSIARHGNNIFYLG